MKSLFIFIFSVIIVFFQTLPTYANRPEPKWYAGQLVCTDKKVLEGELCYNWMAETVLFRQADGRIRPFSSEQVIQFGWFDYSVHQYRTFKVLTHEPDKRRKSQAFFEICMDGPLTVVRHLKPLRGLNKYFFTHPTQFYDQPTLANNPDSFDYFVYDAGRLRAIDRFYSDVYMPLMTTYKKQLNQYIETHNINDRTLFGRLVLIDQYNLLVERDSKTASIKDIAP